MCATCFGDVVVVVVLDYEWHGAAWRGVVRPRFCLARCPSAWLERRLATSSQQHSTRAFRNGKRVLVQLYNTRHHTRGRKYTREDPQRTNKCDCNGSPHINDF